MRLATQRVVLACFGAAALAGVGCADGSVNPISPSASLSGTVASRVSASFPRSGELHVTKECSDYHGLAGEICTITSSNLDAIEVGSRVVYARAADFGTFTLDSDVVLDPPGPGNNVAFGHCHLNLVTGIGLCKFSGVTGTFTHFDASVDVSPPTDGVNWHWTGTYSFSPRD
jgi:polyisoprenoid-binding protein YceI